MKNLDDLTVVIVTFQTPEKIILDCLNSINKSVNVIIVENSKIFLTNLRIYYNHNIPAFSLKLCF